MPDITKLYHSFIRYLPSCRNEEELRQMFSLRILPYLDLPDSDVVQIRHEYSVLSGRLDSLYGKAILEFKAPGTLPRYATDQRFLVLKNKMSQYIKDVAREQKIDRAKIIGIIFDGYRIAYHNLFGNAEVITGPYVVDRPMFKTLVDRLTYGLTVPKALTQANLIADFGLASTRCVPFVRALYAALKNSSSDRTRVLYGQWKIYFREICGYDFTGPKKKNLRRITSANYSIRSPDIEALTFSIHTYFSIVLTLFAVRIGHILADTFDSARWLASLDTDADVFEERLRTIFDGVPFKEVGFSNLIEPTFFQWFIDELNVELRALIQELAELFAEYSTETLRMKDIGESDILKDLYQSLSPPALRHALGEYYTPDWLADLALDRIKYSGTADSNVLDPTCGSGTFLVRVIGRYKAANVSLSLRRVAHGVLDHIRGIDLNPLAVTASKLNYLIAMGEELIKSVETGGFEIPVYLSDAMLAPLEHKYETGCSFVIPTKVANFSLPKPFVEDVRFLGTMTTIEEAVREQWDFAKLRDFAIGEHHWTEKELDDYVKEFYEILLRLEYEGLNGVWASIIKNFFAPSFMRQVDHIVGNPPWVNWENLPESYRDSIKKYWSAYAYNLFRHRGLAARLGSAHDDICVLLTYIVADVFLRDKGTIGFVLPQTLFKSKGGGEGFRTFEIKNNFTFRVISVDDLVDLNAFEASNKPSLFCAVKGPKTKYPARYYNWKRPPRLKISSRHDLDAVKQLCTIVDEIAYPIDPLSPTSPWLTGNKGLVDALRVLVGPSQYRARKGVDTSLNAVFWVKVLETDRDFSKVLNCQTRSRSEVRQKTVWIENEALWPLLRGSDFTKWTSHTSYQQILLYDENTGKPVSEKLAARNFPKAWQYFTKDPEYVALLYARGIYNKHLQGLPIYSCYDIGPYSFAEQKVIWKALASGIQAAVINNTHFKVIVPDHNVMMIQVAHEDEAHYICAVLNSDVATLFATSYIEWFYSTHLLEYFKIPTWDSTSELHRELSDLSKAAHLGRSNRHELAEIEESINNLVRRLLNFKVRPH